MMYGYRPFPKEASLLIAIIIKKLTWFQALYLSVYHHYNYYEIINAIVIAFIGYHHAIEVEKYTLISWLWLVRV